MKNYILYIKSEIKELTPKILNTVLCISGHNASIYENILFESDEPKVVHEYNIIEFTDLKAAQKVETELRKMYSCFLVEETREFSYSINTTEIRIVNLTSFKENGHYYDNFNVSVPLDNREFNLIENILKSNEKLPEYFIYYGHYANNVPFIIPAHTKASDMKPYIKLE